MIQEILDEKIGEVGCNPGYELTEFQLGEVPMNIFIREMQSLILSSTAEVSISTIHSYKGITIKRHHSHDAIMFCVSLKKIAL